MASPFSTSSDPVKSKLRPAARRCALVATLSSLALLSAPFVKTPDHQRLLAPPSADSPKPEARVGMTFRRGGTLDSALKRFGVQPPSARAMLDRMGGFLNLEGRQGDNGPVVVNSPDRAVDAMEFVAEENLFRVKVTDRGWMLEHQKIPFIKKIKVIRGIIKLNLYEDGSAASLSPQQVSELTKIFEYDIDLFSDLRRQDNFSVLVEVIRYADGRRTPGRVLAAELEAGDRVFDAFYFVAKDGSGDYYNGKGEALRRSFLRAPLSYVRVSSPFDRHRMHPILRTVQPHLAIDYDAPGGTPVVAVGRGRVEFAGWRNGYGNVIDIRHFGSYLSRYAHFSRFTPNLRIGQLVEPGDVIGYVGQTGHATGPHLHFEFLRGDTRINFLDLRMPKDEQLSGEDLPRFNQLREQQQALLRGEKQERVLTNRASNS